MAGRLPLTRALAAMIVTSISTAQPVPQWRMHKLARTAPSRALLGLLLVAQAFIVAAAPAFAEPGVNGRNVTVVTFGLSGRKLGEFRQTGPGIWIETNAVGKFAFGYGETQRDDAAVHLFDPSRNVRLRLDLSTRQVMYSSSGSPLTFLYDVLSAAATPVAAAPKQRPVYAIAHRVLTKDGVTDALNDGANAIEIDVCAYAEGWWADHDCIHGSIASDKITDIFGRIREERQKGRTVTFVWLDIKNPDYCTETDDYVCSMAQLMADARSQLESVDVEIILGFYGTEGGIGWNYARDNRNAMEGIALSGKARAVRASFESKGPQIPASHRIMDYGYFNIGNDFGDCTEASYYTCAELKAGVAQRNAGSFAKVFGWTTASGHATYVDALLRKAGVDGIIYGFKATYYYDHTDTQAAAEDIRNWVANNSETHRLATQADTLFLPPPTPQAPSKLRIQ